MVNKYGNVQVKQMQPIPNIFGKNDFGPAFYRLFLPWAIRHPRYLRSTGSLLRAYTKTLQLRKKLEVDKIKVPPTLILNLTTRCNLSCSGCFAEASGITCNKGETIKKKPHLDWNGWIKVISEASELGVFGYFLAGGEPFLFPKIIN